MSGPLEGVKVVDCTTWLQGPFAATLLGDLGAEVIKIEQRGAGDPLRGYLVGHYQEYERNVPYRSINRNKRGMALDLRKQQGREIIYQLIKKSDVFMHNLRPQAAKKLG
jgi:formyl-CoA transferase